MFYTRMGEFCKVPSSYRVHNYFHAHDIKDSATGFKVYSLDAYARFSYKSIPMRAYSLGVDWVFDSIEGGKFIATPEKSLCDKIRYHRGIGTLTQKAMLEYLEEDLRIDINQPLDIDLIETIAEAYGSRNLKTLAAIIRKVK